MKCIADDVLIYGRDDADHDSCLEGFMKKCQQKGIKLNPAKLEYKCKFLFMDMFSPKRA